MNELLNKLQRYIKAYKEPPYGKEVEGTTELMEEAFQALIKTSHRVVLLENQFIDGMHVNYQVQLINVNSKMRKNLFYFLTKKGRTFPLVKISFFERY